jgi:hypothetical protein
MPSPTVKSFRNPEQVRRFPNGQIETVSHNETTIGRFHLEPGWRWSRDVGPIAQTRSCQIHHQGVVLRGRLRVEPDAGEAYEVGVDDVYDILPGHDGLVVGDEPFEAIEFASARLFAAPADRGSRARRAALHGYCGFDCTSEAPGRLRLGRAAPRAQPAGAQRVQSLSRARDTNHRRRISCHVRRSRPGGSLRPRNWAVGRRARARGSRWGSHRRGRIDWREHPRSCRSRNCPYRRSCEGGARYWFQPPPCTCLRDPDSPSSRQESTNSKALPRASYSDLLIPGDGAGAAGSTPDAESASPPRSIRRAIPSTITNAREARDQFIDPSIPAARAAA